MSNTMTEYWNPAQAIAGEPDAVDTAAIPPAQVYRSWLIPIAFLFPVFLSGTAYAAGSMPILTDLAFLLVAVFCAVLLVVELLAFGYRQGIGAILIYGGVLVWFCNDYFSYWFLRDFNQLNQPYAGISAAVVARAAFYHCLFIDLMLVSFRFPVFRFVEKVITAVPEPRDRRFYLWVTLGMLLFGWSAFLFTKDPFYVSILKGALWPIMGGVDYTVFRTGNMNYNWGGYVAQIIQVGEVGGILGAFYAISIARWLPGKCFGWFCWAYWFSFSFAGERRGNIAFMALPVVGLLFLKYHARAVAQFKRISLKPFIAAGIVAFGLLFAVQWQSADRLGYASVKMFRAAGNTMFSEGLEAWALIPSMHNYAYDNFPGETIIRPLPEVLSQFVIGPIPRALWTNKPGPEDFSLWYSTYISQDARGVRTGGVQGTTVSGGAVGAWYFRYGPIGVIEGALLYGWLMGVTERSLRRANGRPMALLFALGFATFMFRAYRDLWWHNLDPLIVAGVVLTIMIRLFFGGRRADPAQQAVLGAAQA
jgi:hypothetical protein